MKPYPKPTPAFGPGSVEYTRRQTEELELLGSEHATEDASEPDGPGSKSYAGAEAYY